MTSYLLRLCVIGLIVIYASGCATVDEPIDLTSAACEVIPQEELWACVKKDEFKKLKLKLNKCEKK